MTDFRHRQVTVRTYSRHAGLIIGPERLDNLDIRRWFRDWVKDSIRKLLLEIHYTEQFVISFKGLYAMICQAIFFTLCLGAVEMKVPRNTENHVVTALTTILFYSLFAHVVFKIRDVWRRNSFQSLSMPSYRNWIWCLYKLAVEWLRALVILYTVRQQSLHFQPTPTYCLVTFTYYLCSEKIFLEVIPVLVEYLQVDLLENLEFLYVHLLMYLYTIMAGIVVMFYYLKAQYSPFAAGTLYFIIYLRIKDVYFNKWKALLAKKQILQSFRVATHQDIQNWADICAVCLDNMSRARVTTCNHLFHPYCLRKSLQMSFNCPLCKRNFLRDNHR